MPGLQVSARHFQRVRARRPRELELPLTAAAFVVKPEKPQLFDLPVSNNGARVRMILYYKGLEGEVDVVSPMELGGLKAEECAHLTELRQLLGTFHRA